MALAQEEKHKLELTAIDLEKVAAYAHNQTYTSYGPRWSKKTAAAFRGAARLLRKALEE